MLGACLFLHSDSWGKFSHQNAAAAAASAGGGSNGDAIASMVLIDRRCMQTISRNRNGNWLELKFNDKKRIYNVVHGVFVSLSCQAIENVDKMHVDYSFSFIISPNKHYAHQRWSMHYLDGFVLLLWYMARKVTSISHNVQYLSIINTPQPSTSIQFEFRMNAE